MSAETAAVLEGPKGSRLYAALRRIASLPSAIRENPVFARQMAVTLGGTKFALTFILVNAAHIIALLVTIADLAGFPGYMGQMKLGAVLAAILGSVNYFLLAFLLPLQSVRFFESQRHDGSFDQVVSTGVPPLRVHFGNWTATLCYAVMILVCTSPYLAFAHSCGGVSAGEILWGYGLLLIYSNVIVLVTMALGVALHEVAAFLMSLVAFGLLGMFAFPPIPNVLASWTPLRDLLRPAGQFFFGGYFSSMYLSVPSLFSVEIPPLLYSFGIWALFAGAALAFLALGPSHVFSPGLNNFGNVVLRGDRKRSRLRTLRFSLNRRVEMAFLYENRSPRWDAWDWAIRSLSILAFVGVFWTIFIGFVFSPAVMGGPSWPRQEEFQIYVLCMGGAGLAFGLLFYGESRDRIYERQKVGPIRIPREILAGIFFAALLAGFWAIAYYPITWPLEDQIQAAMKTGTLQSIPEVMRLNLILRAVPERIQAIAVFAATIFLLSRLLARITRFAAALRAQLLILTAILLFAPLLTIPLFDEKVITSRPLARLAFISPVTALMESFEPNDSMFRPDRLGSGKEFQWKLHLGISSALLLAIIALHVRRFLRERRARAKPSPGPAAPAAAAALLALGLLAGPLGEGRIGAGEVQVEAVRGFNGHRFSQVLDFFTVVLSRGDPGEGGGRKALPVELSIESEDGVLYAPPRTVEVPPGTRAAARIAVGLREELYQFSHGDVKLVVRGSRETQEIKIPAAIIESPEKARFLAIAEEGRTPPVLVADQSWTACKPAWLPERADAYLGCEMVLVGPVDLGSWTEGQRRALREYVRLGGTAVFFGALDPRALAAAPEWAEVLTPAEPPRTEASGIPFRIHRLKAGRTVWSEGEGPGAIPVLQIASVGPGKVGYLAVDPTQSATAERFGGPQRFWSRFARSAPYSLPTQIPLVGAQSWRLYRRGGTSILAVAAYFISYGIILGPAMLFIFRARRRRIWVWIFTPAVSLLFVLAGPLAFSIILSDPSPAFEATFDFLDGSGRGVRHALLQICSSGRQEHRIRGVPEDAALYLGSSEWMVPLEAAREEGGSGPVRISVPPWGGLQLLAVSESPRSDPTGVRGRATRQANGSWLCEVEGIRAGTKAALAIVFPDPPLASGINLNRQVYSADCIVQEISSWMRSDGPARGTISSSGQRWGFPDLNLGFHVARSGRSEAYFHPRAFAIWKAPEDRPAMESEDLLFEDVVGRRAFAVQEIEVVVPEEVQGKSR